ncbi:UNKNOWN [Stylonychia lemnae]|uniref:Uncharacterized protein n=1 Tax=Stylonychia lemnae TaxID=5949 RepID=A0A078AKN3_STYLE|nr:UNKNOWN [Stylonychia lemnae]|eukprot:CDW82446.1 UNKNOWN [Stylonychia lemnae]
MSSSQIEDKLDQFKKQIKQNNHEHSANRANSSSNKFNNVYGSQERNKFDFEDIDGEMKHAKNVKRMQSEAAFGTNDDKAQLRLKKNPNFGNQQQQTAQNYGSSDDDIPVGFSRRKRLSSNSSFQKKFESNIANAPNIVNLSRKEDNFVRSQRGDTQYQESNIDELNRQIKIAKEQEEERIHQQTEALLEQKREQIQQNFREHQENTRVEKELQKERDHRRSHHKKEAHYNDGDHEQHRNTQKQDIYAQNPHIQFPYISYDMMQKGNPLMAPAFQNPMYSNQMQNSQMYYPSMISQQYLGSQTTLLGQNYFPPQTVPNLPQYTNLDIPAHLDQNLKSLKETLQKLKGDNMNLKQELNKKQLLSIDLENNAVSNFDKEKYQQHAQNNLKLKQSVEDLKRKEIELKSRLSTLQANKQYLNGRTNTLSMDIDIQDKQEEALNKQIVEFNGLIREKENYIKQLMNELNQLKESKEQFQSELGVLNHKEEFMVNELIFKEDQLNEIMMSNEDMRRKIQSGQSQSKYLLSENERLKKELSQLKEESAVLKASSDFLNNEYLGLNEHIQGYEHKLILSQNTIEQLQRQNQQEKSELAHYNATISSQQKAYEELKNQLQIINERNSRISLQNEMMMLRQQQNQEQLMLQMSQSQAMQRIQQEEIKSNPFPMVNEQSMIEETIPFEDKLDTEKQVIRESVNNRRNTHANELSQRLSSPYQDIQRRAREGEGMSGTMKWENENNNLRQSVTAKPNSRLTEARLDQSVNFSPEVKQQLRNQGQTMAGLLSHENDAEKSFTQRHSMPVNMSSRFKRDAMQSPGQEERSKSGRRADQMNSILKWSQNEEEFKGQPRKTYNDQQQIIQEHRDVRSISGDRKQKEGQQMAGLMSWEVQDTDLKKNQTRRSTATANLNQASSKQIKVHEIDLGRNSSPNEIRNQIRDKHYGSSMANLIAFENPEQSQINQLQKSKTERAQQRNSQVNLNSQQMKMNAVKKVGIDLSKVEAKQTTITMSPNNQSDLKIKNYGNMNEKSHQQQVSRKENLDKMLLQMQIEKEKMTNEIAKIGDFPKTTQQMRRKEELSNEVYILNSNISNIKNKIKTLKPQ